MDDGEQPAEQDVRRSSERTSHWAAEQVDGGDQGPDRERSRPGLRQLRRRARPRRTTDRGLRDAVRAGIGDPDFYRASVGVHVTALVGMREEAGVDRTGPGTNSATKATEEAEKRFEETRDRYSPSAATWASAIVRYGPGAVDGCHLALHLAMLVGIAMWLDSRGADASALVIALVAPVFVALLPHVSHRVPTLRTTRRLQSVEARSVVVGTVALVAVAVANPPAARGSVVNPIRTWALESQDVLTHVAAASAAAFVGVSVIELVRIGRRDIGWLAAPDSYRHEMIHDLAQAIWVLKRERGDDAEDERYDAVAREMLDRVRALFGCHALDRSVISGHDRIGKEKRREVRRRNRVVAARIDGWRDAVGADRSDASRTDAAADLGRVLAALLLREEGSLGAVEATAVVVQPPVLRRILTGAGAVAVIGALISALVWLDLAGVSTETLALVVAVLLTVTTYRLRGHSFPMLGTIAGRLGEMLPWRLGSEDTPTVTESAGRNPAEDRGEA